MDSLHRLVARDSAGPSDTVIDIMIALLALVFFALILVAVLVLLKRLRRQQQMRAELLPSYHDNKRSANHRGLTISTSGRGGAHGRTSVIVFGKDGEPMLTNPNSPPHSPDNVPEIHITFPDEHDDQGRRKSGRVVVVRVGDATVGLEPLDEDELPAYEKEGGKSQFYAIDMEKIGGLKEKERYGL